MANDAAPPRTPAAGTLAVPPVVVDGEVLYSVDIHPYPNALTALGGCTNFGGHVVTDPAELAAIRGRAWRAGLPVAPLAGRGAALTAGW